MSEKKHQTSCSNRVFNADVKGFDCGDKAAQWLSRAVHSKEEKQEEGKEEDKRKEEAKEEFRLLYNGNLTRARKAREPAYYSFPQYKSSDRVSGRLGVKMTGSIILLPCFLFAPPSPPLHYLL